MFGSNIKIHPADKYFSLLIRERDKWTCVRCGRKHEERKMTLDTSHFFTRGKKSTRFDFENCDSLCKLPCHLGKNSMDSTQFGWEYQKGIEGFRGVIQNGSYTQFKINQLGRKRFDDLMVRANTPVKVDFNLMADIFKKELKKHELIKKSLIFGAR